MTVTRGQIAALATPILTWAVHFIVLYALVSAACAPRMLMPVPVMQVATWIATVAAVVVAGVPVLFTGRQEGAGAMRPAILLTVLISVIAILADALAFAFFATCGG